MSHGTGCTLSSAIATYLAKGNSLAESIIFAKEYIAGAIREGKDVVDRSMGPGPAESFIFTTFDADHIMKFTDLLWAEALPIFEQIQQHPFNQELKEGTLPLEKFQILYLPGFPFTSLIFARALAVAGTKAGNSHELLDFLQFAQNAILVERALHLGYFKEYVIDYQSGKAPGCFCIYQLPDGHQRIRVLRSDGSSVAALFLDLQANWRLHLRQPGDAKFPIKTGLMPMQVKISRIPYKRHWTFATGWPRMLRMLRERKMIEAYVTASKLEYVFLG